MEDRLLNYYERELTYIREMGAEFAQKYPKIAGRLLLEDDKCEDPHTERLIEAFALLCGRIHKKIDDDFPEITEAMLSIVYPHYTNPIPSMALVNFVPIKQNISPSGYRIKKGAILYSKPVGGVPCQFTTNYPVELWPVEVTSAILTEPRKLVQGAVQAICIKLKTFNELDLAALKWKKLRFFLNGPSQHIYHLYELINNNLCQIECVTSPKSDASEHLVLSPDMIQPVGFDSEEGLLPLTKRSFPGYRLLLEYFCFPEKFLFFDLLGIDRFKGAKLGDSLEIWFYLNQPAKTNLIINKDTFRLNTTPAINLFKRIAEPIRVEHRKSEYLVIPDIRRKDSTEIYTIQSVMAANPANPDQSYTLKPFYSIRHHLEEEDKKGRNAYWHILRRNVGRKGDNGTDVFLSFVDLDFKPTHPAVEILTIHSTCTNRDLPGRLPFGDPSGDFNMEIAAPVERIQSLIKPTPSRRPFLGGSLQWRLISHLSLNYLSLVKGGERALREILKLYDFDNSPTTRQQINGISGIDYEHVTKRLDKSFCRGVRVNVTFDETKYVGTGLYLFASVLERFLGQYVSVNSFSQMTAFTLQRKEALKQWAPRSGNRIIL